MLSFYLLMTEFIIVTGKMRHSPVSWAHIKYFRHDGAGPYLAGGWDEDMALHEYYMDIHSPVSWAHIKYFRCDGARPYLAGGMKALGGYGTTWILCGRTFTSQLSTHQIFQVWWGWASICRVGGSKPSGWKCSYMETGFHHIPTSWDKINHFSCDKAGTISDSCELT